MALTLRNPPARVPETEYPDGPPGSLPGGRPVIRRKRGSFTPPAFVSFLAGFLLSAGLGAFFIYHHVAKLNWVELEYFKWFRLAFLAVFMCVLVGTAFQQSPAHGVACVLCPPYTIVYALIFLDSPALRGLIYGIVAWFGAEVYYMNPHSFLTACRHTSNELIADVNGLIERSSR